MIGDIVPSQPANDPVEAPTNGKIQRDTAARPTTVVDDDEQLRSDSEQTLSDTDQTLSDTDQTSADRDQAGADSDQVAADQDQVASDRELAAGGSPSVHDAGRDVRKRTTRRREQIAGQRDRTAQRRLDVANRRDAVAEIRDLAALARDQAAVARDLAMARLDAAHDDATGPRAITGREIVLRAAEQRRRAARYRAKAAEHRAWAAEDRQVAARDREDAARERQEALADREALARALAAAATDELTGARTRAAGLADLEHEIDRCRRTSGPLVVAYVDAIGLKTVNDTLGHAAGDALLKLIVGLIKDQLRSYDLVIRVGGDEFVCAMSKMTVADARSRFIQVTNALASSPQPGAIRVGFAELSSDDTAEGLIARADSELLTTRGAPPAGG